MTPPSRPDHAAEELTDIAARWAEIEARVPGLAEDVRTRVATWRYWTGWSDAGPSEPLAEERHGWPPKDYEERRPPGDAGRITTCGYDADDRIVLTETGGYDRELEVFTYAGDHAESYQFDLGSPPGDSYNRPPGLLAVRRWWWSDGLLRARVTYRRRKPSADIRWRSEAFEYDGDGRLRAVRDEPNTRITRVHWTDEGTLDEITAEAPDAPAFTVYTHPRDDQAAIEQRYAAVLANHIPAWARNAWPDDPVLGLVLVTSGGIPVPPTPLLVTSADFEKILETSDDPLSAWGPGDFERHWAGDEFDDGLDASARKDAQVLNQLWHDSDDADMRFFAELARTLARMDWSDLPGGDRLIVAFIYAENTGDSEFFAADPAHLTKLRQRGWLPER